MIMNNRNLEKKEENESGNRPKVVSEIYELCRLLSEHRKDMDDSCSENISEISLSSPPNANQSPKQNIQNISFLEKSEISISTPGSNSIPFDKQKHTSGSLQNSDLLFGNHHSDVKDRDSPLSFESNMDENEAIQRHKECAWPAVYKPLNGKCNVLSTQSNIKTIPFISSSHCQFEAPARDKFNYFENKTLLEDNLYNIIPKIALENSNLSCDLRLKPKVMFSAPESSRGMYRSMASPSKSLGGLQNLFHESPYSGKQNALSFNSMDSSGAKFLKDNSLCNTDKLTKQYHEMKSNYEQILHSAKTENKFLAFNFSLHLGNERKFTGEGRDLNQMTVSRRPSEPSIAGFMNKVKNPIFVETTWHGRKCKSEVQILHEGKCKPEFKFLTKNPRNTRLELNPGNFRKSSESLGSSKMKRIPTFRGHKLPAKVSVLLLNGPIRLNFIENISGKSQEILMFTSDVIEDVRSEHDTQQQDMVKRILARSRPYIGKPVHIIFDPTKTKELTTGFTSSADLGEGNFVPLHSSAAKHNLLAEEPKEVASATDYHTDADMTLCSNWENSSDETLVVKKNGHLKEIENRMSPTDSTRLDTAAEQNNRLEASTCTRSTSLQAKKKLKIRLCRRKKSRTASKQVNVKQIVNSVFRNIFHFYSVVRGHLKSGSVITKSNSILWLREAGVATDARSREIANQLFKDIAGAKIVLNIFDYMQFLIMFARRQRMATVDLVRQLTIYELPLASKIQLRRSSESRRLKTLPQLKHSEQRRTEIVPVRRSQSLPNLKTNPPVLNR